MQSIVPRLAETALNSLQRVREMEAAMTDVALLPGDSDLGKIGLAAGADYAAGVEESGRKSHDPGCRI